MKIRNGFVSNSSSSSFLIVGVEQVYDYEGKRIDLRLEQLVKADKPNLEDGFGGEYNGKTLVFLGGEADWNEDNVALLNSYTPYYIGINAEEGLKSGKTVPELKKEFIEKAKKLGVIFTEDEVDLYYGEVSSE